MYFVEKNLTRFHNLGYTYFLNPSEIEEVRYSLKKGEYSIYFPYDDAEKCMLYRGSIPEVLLYEIKSKVPIRHQDILGTMYSLNISDDLFGDIVAYNNRFYIYILPIVRNYFESNFIMIKNSYVEIQEVSLDELSFFTREYEKNEIIVSSNRIDNVISSILHVGRNNIDSYIKKKEILLNYDCLKNGSYKLKVGDTFSIRRVGKFKYNGILKNTKSNHLVIEVLKYK